MLLSLRNFSASSHRMQPIRSTQTKVRVKSSKQTPLNTNGWPEKSSVKHRKRELKSARRRGKERRCRKVLHFMRAADKLDLSHFEPLSESVWRGAHRPRAIHHTLSCGCGQPLIETGAWSQGLPSFLKVYYTHRSTTMALGTQRCLTCAGWDWLGWQDLWSSSGSLPWPPRHQQPGKEIYKSLSDIERELVGSSNSL